MAVTQAWTVRHLGCVHGFEIFRGSVLIVFDFVSVLKLAGDSNQLNFTAQSSMYTLYIYMRHCKTILSEVWIVFWQHNHYV